MGKAKKHRNEGKKQSSKKKAPAGDRSGRDSLPESVQRSGKKARRTFVEARNDALKKNEDGKRAEIAAFQALERAFQKIGDRWKRKDKKRTKGPGSPAATQRAQAPRVEQVEDALAGERAKSTPTAAAETIIAEPSPTPPVQPDSAPVEPVQPEPATSEPAVQSASAVRSEPAEAVPGRRAPARRRSEAVERRSTKPAVGTGDVAPQGGKASPDLTGAAGVSREAPTTLLREAARRLEIRGRSRMTRDELLSALDEAGALTPGGSEGSRRNVPARPQ